jgi:hypothetical protein
MERADALEAAYNPNDCPELRWGAEAGASEEAAHVQAPRAADRSAAPTRCSAIKELVPGARAQAAGARRGT